MELGKEIRQQKLRSEHQKDLEMLNFYPKEGRSDSKPRNGGKL